MRDEEKGEQTRSGVSAAGVTGASQEQNLCSVGWGGSERSRGLGVAAKGTLVPRYTPLLQSIAPLGAGGGQDVATWSSAWAASREH